MGLAVRELLVQIQIFTGERIDLAFELAVLLAPLIC